MLSHPVFAGKSGAWIKNSVNTAHYPLISTTFNTRRRVSRLSLGVNQSKILQSGCYECLASKTELPFILFFIIPNIFPEVLLIV